MIKIKSVEYSISKKRLACMIISISMKKSYLPCCLFRVCFIDKIRILDQAIKREKLMLFKIDNETKTTSSLRHRYADDVAHYE